MSASICTISNDQPDPQYQARRSKDNEPAQIPEQRIRYPDPNAMNADDPMDQHHVHELPDAKAKDRPGQEDAIGRTAITMAPEDQERSNCNHIDGNVKQTTQGPVLRGFDTARQGPNSGSDATAAPGAGECHQRILPRRSQARLRQIDET